MGIWELGSRWLVRDKPKDASLGNDFITQEFLRTPQNLNSVPLISHMQKLSKPTDSVDITLMSRAEGVGLDKVWRALNSQEKLNYTNQLGNAIQSLH